MEEKKPFLKRSVPIWAFVLTIVLLGAVVASVVLTEKKPVTIVESLLLLSPTEDISLFAGETRVVNFTVTNFASVTIPAILAVSLSPPSADITISVAPSMDFAPGVNTVPVTVETGPGTVKGVYTVELSVTR